MLNLLKAIFPFFIEFWITVLRLITRKIELKVTQKNKMIDILKAILLFFIDFWIAVLCIIIRRIEFGRVKTTDTRKKKTYFPLKNLPLLATVEIIKSMSIKDQKKTYFPLKDLPHLATTEIIKSMSIKDQIRLALSSEKHEELCKIARVKVTWLCLRVRDEYSSLDISPKTMLCCDETLFLEKGFDTILLQELAEWCESGNILPSLQNLMSVFKRVNAIFKCDEFHLFIDMSRTYKISMREIMVIPLLKNCENLALSHGRIESTDLCYLLDSMKHLKYLRFLGTKIPRDFQHERTFLMERIVYEDANWVKLENLLTMGRCTNVKLGENQLTYQGLNRFLKLWVNSTVDMFNNMTIEMRERIDPQVLFEGLLRLDSSRFIDPTYFIIADSTMVNRRKPLLYVYYGDGTLRLFAYARNTVWFRGNEDQSKSTEKKTFMLEFDALRVLQKREELRKKMEIMEEAAEDDTKMMEELNIELNGLLEKDLFKIGE